MRLLCVLQRYGHEVAGGAERHCREFATRLAALGHDVEVLTSCAVNHADWANAYPEGTTVVDGVPVHRLKVSGSADASLRGSLTRRAIHGRLPLYLQRYWLEVQGPWLGGLVPWLSEWAPSYDVVVFFTYLWYPTWAGLPAVAGRVPCVLHPTAHNEPALCVPVFDTTFRHPSAFAFSTEEERALVTRRFHITQPSAVIGVGVDLDAGPPADEAGFREAYGLGERPYLVFVGRVEPGKGSVELSEFFAAYKRRNPGPLALVVVGTVVTPLPEDPDVVVTGFVDEATKRAALSGAVALVQPSYFESFSMVLTEAWAQRKAALVQGHCDVLVGQARRSGGGLPYRGFAEFEAAVDRVVGDHGLRARLEAAGRRYVEERYAWPAVLDRYERFLASVPR